MGEKDHSDKQLAGQGELSLVPLDVIRRVRGIGDPIARAAVLADLCRLNTLYMIMNAGSGHIGSSFSSMELIAWLWTDYLVDANSHTPDADIYFSSKGHDAPALYALLIALEKLDFDLRHKFRAFGWEVARADGHDLRKIKEIFAAFDRVTDRPKVLIADTIKGKGVSFMEGLAGGDATYHFHAGAPSLKDYLAAVDEITARVNERLSTLKQPAITLSRAALPVRIAPAKPERLVLAYGDELLQMARTRKEIVVLDGDLLSDCGIEGFKAELPERFIECGIAEQHMVSAAGGMALEGLLPVVHSFACFLSTRANEHIYNNATEC